MKKPILKMTTVAAFLFATSITFTSCGGEKQHQEESHEHAAGEEHEKMKNEEEHDHDEMSHVSSDEMTHACSMHPDVKGKEGDKCSKCDMSLQVIKEE